VSEIRLGIFTIREKWEMFTGTTITNLTEDYLSHKFPMVEFPDNIMINGAYLPNEDIMSIIEKMSSNQAIFDNDIVVAFRVSNTQDSVDFDSLDKLKCPESVLRVKNLCDIYKLNGEAIISDFELLTKSKNSQPIPDGAKYINKELIFIEEGAKLPFCSLNASDGPIYIGKNSEIMEGSLIRGPFAMCENSIVKMGAKIYGSTTIGPYCKVGGEVSNSVFFGYSNKGHDGFLGNSVIGEWCNLGADTNTSNLKNNYANVKLWNYESESFINTNLQFCGLILGDHSKCGINTMFNTGTVVGVFANIFGSGFPRNFVPSFSWGGNKGFTTYLTKKAFEVASIVMERRGCEFSNKDAEILKEVFEISKKYRSSY
jgi:UDP-N-acetylglucosamine diphosphorylase/glucosamine-1-phosphate N-acetyltransferase